MNGAQILAVLFGGALAAAIAIRLRGHLKERWGWVRYPLVFAIIVLLGLTMLTDPWPDGVGIQVCEQEVGGTEAVEVCGPLEPTDLLAIALFALIAGLVAPDISELEIAGLGSVKRAIVAQERRLNLVEASGGMGRSPDLRGSMSSAIQRELDAFFRSGAPPTAIGAAAMEVALTALEAVLAEAASNPPFENCDLRVYELAPGGVLKPIGPGFVEEDEFRPWHGATGQAYSRRESIVVFGEDVNNGAYGLTPEQQRHFASLTGVAATPVLDLVDFERVLGVLTVATEEVLPEDEDLLSELADQWAEALEATAPKVAVVLSALLAR